MSNSTASKLLVSANTIDESKCLSDLQVPWIDLKEPKHGPLGRPDLHLVRRFASEIDSMASGCYWSIAGGELLDWDLVKDREFLEILGAKGHVKWGLSGCLNQQDWPRKLAAMIDALDRPTQAVLVLYADHLKVAGPDWDTVLKTSGDFGLDKILIDTAVKDGSNLLDWLSADKLNEFILEARDSQLQIAIAGSIPLTQLQLLGQLGADWIGVRGAVCSDRNDRTSPIDPNLVLKALDCLPASKHFSHQLGTGKSRPQGYSTVAAEPSSS